MQVGFSDFGAVGFFPGPGEIPDVFQEKDNLQRDWISAWRIIEGFARKKAKGVDGNVIINHAGGGLRFVSD